MFYQSVVASDLFYTGMLGGSVSKKDISRLDELISMKLDWLETVAEMGTV